MELKDFVSQTLVDIAEGVRDAQEKLSSNENPTRIAPRPDFGPMATAFDQVKQIVEFDVAVTSEERKQTKGGIGVMLAPVALGSQGQSTTQSSTVSRLKFTVPVIFDGEVEK